MPPRPLPVIAGVVRCSVIGTTPSGQPWVNVWHWRYAAGASNPGPTEIANLDPIFYRMYVGTAYSGGEAHLAACHSSLGITQINYTPLDGAANTITIPHSAAGSSGGTASLPSEVAPVLTLRTAHRGRRYRGRIYLPATASNTVTTTGGIDPAAASLADKRIKQWIGVQAAAQAIQWSNGVASYGYSVLKDGTISTWTPFFTDCTSVTMDTKFDVQRRRK